MIIYISNSTEYHSRVILTYDTIKTLRVFINQTDDLTDIKRDIIQLLAYNNITVLHKGEALNELIVREIVPIFESKLAPENRQTVNDEKTNLLEDISTMLDTVDQSRLQLNTNSLLRRVGGLLTNQLRPQSEQHVSFITKRNRLSVDTIDMLAISIKKRITDQRLTPPDFTLKTKHAYRRIKNFVHNLTQIWLSYDELLLFLYKINE